VARELGWISNTRAGMNSGSLVSTATSVRSAFRVWSAVRGSAKREFLNYWVETLARNRERRFEKATCGDFAEGKSPPFGGDSATYCSSGRRDHTGWLP
jgi:hypothetical protein